MGIFRYDSWRMFISGLELATQRFADCMVLEDVLSSSAQALIDGCDDARLLDALVARLSTSDAQKGDGSLSYCSTVRKRGCGLVTTERRAALSWDCAIPSRRVPTPAQVL